MTKQPRAATSTPDGVCAIGQRLRRVHPETARVSRVAFDARFQHWLCALLSRSDLSFVHRALKAPTNLLELEAGEGRMQLALDTTEWPALDMALALDDDECACAVATMLLASWGQALSPMLSGLRVVRRKRTAAPANALPPTITLVAGATGSAVGVHRMDPRLADHLRQALGGIRVGALANFGALRLPGRLRLLERPLPPAVLASLRPGDTVLLHAGDGGPDVFPLIFGRGMTMQLSTAIDGQANTLVAHGSPLISSEAQGQDGSGIDELQVPVSFEVDTARISLAELAGIRPGYVIELDRPLMSAMVRLVCHGQTVGHGQLVAVGEQMGVRIIRMGLASTSSAKA